jgi:hypothetical protein
VTAIARLRLLVEPTELDGDERSFLEHLPRYWRHDRRATVLVYRAQKFFGVSLDGVWGPSTDRAYRETEPAVVLGPELSAHVRRVRAARGARQEGERDE